MLDFENIYNNIIKYTDYHIAIVVINIILALLSFFVIRRYVERFVDFLAARRYHSWRARLEKHKPFNQLQYLAPILFINIAIAEYPAIHAKLENYISAYIVINLMLLTTAILKTIDQIYKIYPIAKKYPLTSYIQLLNLLFYITGIVVAGCVLFNKSAVGFLSGIGALTALIILVFRDTILSFIAGVQISANNLIEQGDWITMNSFGADGEVTNVALHFINVQNWDNTVVTIPTYKLIENSFKNWRNVFECGARRMKTAIFIDHDSIRSLNEDEFDKILSLFTEININEQELKSHLFDNSICNLTCFRLYALYYLKQHPGLNHEYLRMARLLDATPNGIPLEIYAFSANTSWSAFEETKANILEHLFSVMKDFDLKTYQYTRAIPEVVNS